jgi:predicted cobalt transporter CbtA
MARIVRTVVGILLASLGVLWTLQGADLIRVKPILCLANCKPLAGGSNTWLVAGLVCVAIGLFLLMRRRGPRK